MQNQDLPYWQRYDWDGDGDVDEDDARVFLSRHLLIRLTDPHKDSIPRAKCRIAGDSTTIYECDAEGIIPIPVPDDASTSIDIEWELPDAEGTDPANRFYWQNTFQLAVKNLNKEASSIRLTHLGFEAETLTEQIAAYKAYFNSKSDDIIREMAEWHDGGTYPGSSNISAADSTSDTSGKKPFYLRILLDPKIAKQLENKFRFFNAEGTYDKTQTVNDDLIEVDEYIDLIFDEIPENSTCSLEISDRNGESKMLFEEIPFSQLNGYVNK